MSRHCPACSNVFEDDVVFCGHDGTITIQVQDPDDVDPRLGTRLGDYVVAARVADGGMGRVYEGRHYDTKQRMAVKILHPEIAADEVAAERFKREYETAEKFQHPHIVDVVEFGETPEGSFFMTMEYLEGEELSQAIAKDGALPIAQAVQVLAQVADALRYAHSFGVVHRDLKPDNIFLSRTDEGVDVRLLDFGSVKRQIETGAKLTAFGTTLGSPNYMSPEQAKGKQDVDQRTDVFAVAAIAYEMLTGTVAFDGSNIAEVVLKIVMEDPPPASSKNSELPSALDAVLLRGVAKEKTERPDGVVELAVEVFGALGLQGDPIAWGTRTRGEIEAALRGEWEPPASKPRAPVRTVPTTPVPPPRESAQGGGAEDAIDTSASSPSGGGKVAMGLAAAVVAALVAAGLYFALG